MDKSKYADRVPFTWTVRGTMLTGCSKHEEAPLAASPKPWRHRWRASVDWRST